MCNLHLYAFSMAISFYGKNDPFISNNKWCQWPELTHQNNAQDHELACLVRKPGRGQYKLAIKIKKLEGFQRMIRIMSKIRIMDKIINATLILFIILILFSSQGLFQN